MRRVVPYIVLILLMLAPLPAEAERYDGSGVSGRISWRVADYHAESDYDDGSLDASSFAQHYSLSYRDSGNLNGGRGGVYSYMLGGEFTGINNRINGEADALSTYKPLYGGQLVIAPGGLPFRLKLYCADSHVTSLIEDSTFGLGDNTLIDPGIATDFSNGKHRKLGATLALGIKNGSYLGGYRETLSKWPRLLMDYSEVEVESFRAKVPQNYRQRNLAFVSLNKKDNWFHYRYLDYKDYLQADGRNDYENKSYILGTIDPVLDRAWINLTNWIKVSADGTFNQNYNARIDKRPVETYTTNLYTIASRDKVRATVFSSYWRERDDDGLKRTLDVPVMIQKVVDRDTSWQLTASVDHESDEQPLLVEDDEIYFLGFRLDTRKSRPNTLSTEGKVEFFEGYDGTGSGLELGLWLASNSTNRPSSDNSLALLLRRFSGEDKAGKGVDYLEEELRLVHARRRGSWRLGVEETLQFGNGTMTDGFGHRIIPKTTLSQSLAPSSTSNRDGATLRNMTLLYGETGIGRTLTNRLELLLDYLSNNGDGNLQGSVTHSLTAKVSRSLHYTMTNRLTLGEGQAASSGALGDGDLAVASTGDFNRSFSHTSVLSYAYSRSLQGGLSLKVKSLTGEESSLHYLGKQDCRYTFYRVNGVVRTLFALEEELIYEEAEIGGAGESRSELWLRGDYYPTSHLSLGASTNYLKFVRGGWEEDSLTASLSAAWTYPLFAVRLVYSQGTRNTTMGELQEQGIKMQMDKTF